jgi:hypothetical protein
MTNAQNAVDASALDYTQAEYPHFSALETNICSG